MGKHSWKTRVIDTKSRYPQSPRGYRNNNPLNIRFSESNDWYGQIGRDKASGGMCVFGNMRSGVRAAFRLLYAYQWRHNKRTVRDLISRWAPKSENNTEAYIKRVCDWMKCEPEFIPHFGTYEEMADCIRMIQGMIAVENGSYDDALCPWYDIKDAYLMAFPSAHTAYHADKLPDVAEALPDNAEDDEEENERFWFDYDDISQQDKTHYGEV